MTVRVTAPNLIQLGAETAATALSNGTAVVRRIGQRTARALKGLVELYLEREPGSGYDWHLGLGVAAMLGVPLVVGDVTGRPRSAALFAVAAWLTAIAVPKSDRRSRFLQYLRAAGLYTASTTIGIATGGHLWAVLAASTVLAAAIPLPGVGIVPLLSLTIAIPSADTGSKYQHISIFAAGCLWAGCVMMIPLAGGRYRPSVRKSRVTPLSSRSLRWPRSVRQEFSVGSPAARYAFRASCAFDVAYLVTSGWHTPEPTWVLIGILTTLRQSWGDTRSRVAKRLIGTAAGCVLTAALLWLLPDRSLIQPAVITVCAAIARPMRGFNYGFWPIFNTPVLLLLTEFGTHLTFEDIGLRMTNNLIGAIIAVAATLFLWPSRERDQIPERLATLLEAHAKLLEAASPGSPLHVHLAHEVTRAAAVAAELAAARGRLADQPRDQQLLSAVDNLLTHAATLRRTLSQTDPGWQRGAVQAEVQRLAARLSRAAEAPITGASLATDIPQRFDQPVQSEPNHDVRVSAGDVDALAASVNALIAAGVHVREHAVRSQRRVLGVRSA